MVNSVGKKLQQARIAKQISVEEAARVTRIRPDKLIDLEEDNYSNFPSMSYAKGFLLLYARFLGVDVRDFADSLHTPNTVSTDDYEYLNAAASAPPPSPARRPYSFAPRRKHSILPVLVFFVLAAIVGLAVWLVANVPRLDEGSDKNASSAAPPAISTLPSPVPVASAIPVQQPAMRINPPVQPAFAAATPVPRKAPIATPPPAAMPAASPAPGLVTSVEPAGTPAPAPMPAATFDPTKEVRRAEPVTPDAPPQAGAPAPQPAPQSAPQPVPVAAGPDTGLIAPASAPASSPAPDGVKELAIRPVRKTWVTIRKDMQDSPPFFQDWLYPGDPPLKLTGRKFWIQVEDPNSIVVTQDGQPLPAGQSAIQIE